jgi:response regulator RpfG family c-di-GMP phosphodiesterase
MKAVHHLLRVGGLTRIIMSDSLTVLCVDDEPNVLLALERVLRPAGIRVLVANGGAQALDLLGTEAVDVLVSDMRMPGMDGAELLARTRDRWPGTVRLLLTGHADQQATVRAINDGQVFGYMAKPWDSQELLATIERAGEFARNAREKQRNAEATQRRADELAALNARLEILDGERAGALEEAQANVRRHYMASIRIFAGLIELRAGPLVGHGRRVAELSRRIALALGCDADLVQRVFIAGLLHDFGLVGMRDSALAKPVSVLDSEHYGLYRRHAEMGERSLLTADELKPIAALIRSHHERFDGKGLPDGLSGEGIELGARIIAAADAYDELTSGCFGVPPLTVAETRSALQGRRSGHFDPKVLAALMRITLQRAAPLHVPPVALGLDQLEPGMVLAADLLSQDGVMLLSGDHVLTRDMISRLTQYGRRWDLALQLQLTAASVGAARLQAQAAGHR